MVLPRGARPGEHPRGGKVHLRLWLAERLADALGATGMAGATLMTWYARLLGAEVGRDVDLHSIPPVTGFLRLGKGASIEPEVDLSGYWVDGDVLRVGELRVGRRARVGARSMLCPGADVGDDAEVAAGSAVFGSVPAGRVLVGRAGSPGLRRRPRPLVGPPGPVPLVGDGVRRGRGATSPCSRCSRSAAGALPVLALADLGAADGPWSTLAAVAPLLVLGTVVGLVVLALLVLVTVRLAARGLEPGVYPVRSRVALAGVGDHAGPRRGPHLAVPALLQSRSRRPGCGSSAPGSAPTSRRRRC